MVDITYRREYYQKITLKGNDKIINNNVKVSVGFEYLDQNMDNSNTHNNNTNGDIENWILQKDEMLTFPEIPEGFEMETPIKGRTTDKTNIYKFNDHDTVYIRPVIKIEIDQNKQIQTQINGQELQILDFQIYYKPDNQSTFKGEIVNNLLNYYKQPLSDFSYDFQQNITTSYQMYQQYKIDLDYVNSDYTKIITTYNTNQDGNYEIFSLGQKGITGVDSIVVGYIKNDSIPSNSYIYIRQYKDNTLVRETKYTNYTDIINNYLNNKKLTWVLTHKKVQGQHQYTLYVFNKELNYISLQLFVDDNEINNNFIYNTNQTNLKTGYNFTQNFNLNFLPDNSVSGKTVYDNIYYDEMYLFNYIPNSIIDKFIKMIYGYKFIVTSKGDIFQNEFEFTSEIPDTTFKLSNNKLKIGLNINEGI